MDTSVGNSVIQWLLFIALTSPILAANNELFSPLNVGCACLNEPLIFNCTTVGSLGSTIWRVAAFDCTQNEIILRHSEYDDIGGTSGLCNGGAISGRSTAVDGNCYTSQLSLTVSRELQNKSVTCLLNLNRAMTLVRSVSIIIASELYNDAPSGVQLTKVTPNELTFSWNPVYSNCTPTNRNIMFDCGTCRTISETTATCTNLQIPSTCSFSIQNVACGQLGLTSTPVEVTLRVPSKPNVSIIPVYSADTQTLIRFIASIEPEATFNIAGDISGSITTYNFSYSGAFTFINSSCEGNDCLVDIDPSFCSSSVNISVIVSALNRLGVGPPSNSTIIGCKNQFVQIEYKSALSAIVCEFLNPTNAVKSCTVMYGQCNPQMLGSTVTVNSTINSIVLDVDPDRLECYVVTATNNEVTVIVEGQRVESQSARNDTIILIAVVIPIVIILIIILIVILLVMIKVNKANKRMTEDITLQYKGMVNNPDNDNDIGNIHRDRQQKIN